MVQTSIRILGWMLLLALVVTGCDAGGSDDNQTQEPTYTVGIALTTSFQYVLSNPFKIEMEALGYIEGENIEYITLQAESVNNLGEIIDQLIEADVDLIYTTGANEAKQAIARTDDIPVVFASGFDEIVEPLVTKQQEGALLTGITMGDATTKRLDLLLRMDSTITRIFAPYDPNNELSALGFELITEIAPELGVEIIGYEAPDEVSSQQAMAVMPNDIDAIFMWLETYGVAVWPQWTELAVARQIPTSLPVADVELVNFLMGYGPRLDIAGRESASIVDRVLKGMPANQILIKSSIPYLTINLAVAEQIDLEISSTLLGQASYIVRNETNVSSIKPELAEEGQACQATLQTAVGSNAVCLETGCDGLVDTALFFYVDKVPVEGCAQAGIIGTCVTPRTIAYFYDGDPLLLASGCAMNEGTWTNTEME